MTHSPTPWELIPADEHHGPYIVNSFGSDVADLYAMTNPAATSVRNGGDSKPIPFTDADDNAAHIVRCVNAHDELVEALSSILDLADRYVGRPTDTYLEIFKLRDKARAALAKVQS